MKPLWSSTDQLTLSVLAGWLQNQGFEVQVIGQDRSTAAGVIPMTECWSDLILLAPEREREARDAVRSFFDAGPPVQGKWRCPACNEVVEGQFTQCWKCASERTTAYELSPIDERSLRSLLLRNLRLLVHAQIMLSLTITAVHQYSYGKLPLELRQIASRSAPHSFWSSKELVITFYLLTALTWFGLLVSWNPARFLAVALSFVTLVDVLFAGVSLSTGPLEGLRILNAIVTGSILTLIWLTPLGKEFVRRGDDHDPEV